MADPVAYAVLMGLANTVFVKLSLANVYASTREYYDLAEGWVVPALLRGRKRMDVWDLADRFNFSTRVMLLFALAFLIIWIVFYSTTYGTVATTNPWRPNQMLTVGWQGIFFAVMVSSLAAKALFYTHMYELVWHEKRRGGYAPISYAMVKDAGRSAWLSFWNLVTDEKVTVKGPSIEFERGRMGWYTMAWGLVKFIYPMSVIAFCILNAVILGNGGSADNAPIDSGYPAFINGQLMMAAWGILAGGYCVQMVARYRWFERKSVATGRAVRNFPRNTRKGAVRVGRGARDVVGYGLDNTLGRLGGATEGAFNWATKGRFVQAGNKLVPLSFIEKCSPLRLDPDIMTCDPAEPQIPVSKHAEIGSNPEPLKRTHPEVTMSYLTQQEWAK